MKLSRFDAVTSFLLSMVLFLGILVSFMFIVWVALGEREAQNELLAKPMAPTIRTTSLAEFDDDFETPELEEVVELRAPSLTETLESIRVISPGIASVSAPRTGATVGSFSPDFPSRSPGPATCFAGQEIIERWNRWEIRFHVRDIKDYASQLDHFRFELAAFGGDQNVIDSVTNLSTKPKRHLNRDPESEARLYFSWKQHNPLEQFDRHLLSSAGVPVVGRSIIRFTPAAVENALLLLEKQHCESNGKEFPSQIAKTVFESHAAGDDFEFAVIAQRYR